MERFFFTWLALSALAGVFLVEHLSASADVSPETRRERYRETFLIREGVSPNGIISVTSTSDAPPTATPFRGMNHKRNLRAYAAMGTDGIEHLYVENKSPKQHVMIGGAWKVSEDALGLVWLGTTTLSFLATDTDGSVKRYQADLSTLTASIEAVGLPILPELPSPDLIR